MGHSSFDPPILSGWIKRIKHILGSLTTYTITHIYRKANMEADKLSKDGIGDPYRITKYRNMVENTICDEGLLTLP